MWWRRKAKRPMGFLDRELGVLPGIPFTGKMATEGVFVTAELGWGKTKLTFMRWLKAYLPVMGGVILGQKAEDAPGVQKLFADEGASDRLVMLGPRHGNRFNWLEALLGIAPKGCETEEVVGGMASLVEVDQRNASNSGGENSHFFKTMAMFLLAAMVTMLRLAGVRLSPAALYRFLTSLPVSQAALDSEVWKKHSYANACMEKAFHAARTPAEKADYQTAIGFLVGELMNLNDRTRTNICSSVSAMLSKMLRPWLQDLYGSDSNVRLQDAFEGKWFYFDTSPVEFGEYGTYSLVMAKHFAQRMIQRRRIEPDSKPCGLIFDEAQTVFVTGDRDHQAVCRSKLGCTWAASQNLTGLYAVLGGGPAAEAQAKSWLALFGCKVFGTNTDWATNTYASEMCGQGMQTFMSGNSNHGEQENMYDLLMGQNSNFSSGWSERYEPLVRPEHFVRLRKPEPPSYEADAIVIMPRLQQMTGCHWTEVTFRLDGR
jgi:type IV secretory pathway TraG/TraD family ATPase VirD4